MIPEGLEVDPEAETFEGMAVFSLNGDGTMSLKTVDGLDVGGEKEEENEMPSEEETIQGFVAGQMQGVK